MPVLKKIVFLAINACLVLSSFAQKSELGLNGGVSYYVGDLNPSGHFKYIDPAGGIHYKENLGTRLSLRAGFLYAQVRADDADAIDQVQQNRNLSFYSDIYEVHALMEINFMSYMIGNDHSRIAHSYTPYLFFGLAYFKMNPKTEYNGEMVELQPLGTEGQGTSVGGKAYSLNQIAMPVGLGFKFNVGKHMAVSLEYGLRKLFTDYLDDVSGTYADPVIIAQENGTLAAALADRSIQQEGPAGNNAGTNRGNSFTKDWYAYTGITLSFIMGKGDPCENFGRNRFE